MKRASLTAAGVLCGFFVLSAGPLQSQGQGKKIQNCGSDTMVAILEKLGYVPLQPQERVKSKA